MIRLYGECRKCHRTRNLQLVDSGTGPEPICAKCAEFADLNAILLRIANQKPADTPEEGGAA